MSTTPQAALDKFWNGFGLPAYPSNAVPEDTAYPWITYENPISDFGDPAASASVKLWYHTDSESEPNKKVREISDKIGRGGILLTCEGGAIWITKGSPFCTSINNETDHQVKGRNLNIELEYQL